MSFSILQQKAAKSNFDLGASVVEQLEKREDATVCAKSLRPGLDRTAISGIISSRGRSRRGT